MGKLVIRFKGKLINEVNLKLGDTRIGRKPGCDIVLDDPAVSSEHAVIKTVGTKSTVQDLGSTNGTYVESNRIKQHDLRNGETIIIGGHALIYKDVVSTNAPAFGNQPPGAKPTAAQQGKTELLAPFAQLFGVEGKDKGKRVPLVKEEILMENPGKSPARITRVANGYLVESNVGPGEPRVNDKPIPPGGHLLEKGDILEVAGTKYQFFG